MLRRGEQKREAEVDEGLMNREKRDEDRWRR